MCQSPGHLQCHWVRFSKGRWICTPKYYEVPTSLDCKSHFISPNVRNWKLRESKDAAEGKTWTYYLTFLASRSEFSSNQITVTAVCFFSRQRIRPKGKSQLDAWKVSFPSSCCCTVYIIQYIVFGYNEEARQKKNVSTRASACYVS